jgi:hypothetical protein
VSHQILAKRRAASLATGMWAVQASLSHPKTKRPPGAVLAIPHQPAAASSSSAGSSGARFVGRNPSDDSI